MHYERKLYTLFDMLSDIGGLAGILSLFFGVISAAWNYQVFDNFMVSRLFKIRKPSEEIKPEDEHFKQSKYIELSLFKDNRIV